MERPTFDKLKDARAWLVDDAITRAVLPFRPLLSPDDTAQLLDFLEMLATTHPEVRKLATRAARTFLPLAERPLQAAARLADKDIIPLVPTEEVQRLEPGLAGHPDFKRADFYEASLGVVRGCARFVADKWRAENFDDLVHDGWIAALENAPDWDDTKASYVTFLWGRVRCRLLDKCKKFSNSREQPMAYRWTDKVQASQFESKHPEEQLRESFEAAAMSFGLFLAARPPGMADEEISRIEIRDAIARGRTKLPERQKELIRLHYDEELLLQDVATRLGISDATARRDHHHALVALRHELEDASNVRTLGAPRPPRQEAKPMPAARPKKAPKQSRAKPSLRVVSTEAGRGEDE